MPDAPSNRSFPSEETKRVGEKRNASRTLLCRTEARDGSARALPGSASPKEERVGVEEGLAHLSIIRTNRGHWDVSLHCFGEGELRQCPEKSERHCVVDSL